MRSLRVVRLAWGEVELEDGSVYKDVKIFPGGARPWNWTETGTQHSPGVQWSDVEELLENRAESVVLTRGVLGRLGVAEALIAELETRGIKVYVAKTKKAVQIYNGLCLEVPVGILLHSTC